MDAPVVDHDLVCMFFDRERLGMLRGDVVGAFVYMSNWFNIWSGSSYTSSFSFAPLRHLWSLAVEEQYYLLWPIVMFVVLKRMRQRLLPFIGLFFVAIAVAIAVVTAVMYQTGPIDTFAKTPRPVHVVIWTSGLTYRLSLLGYF